MADFRKVLLMCELRDLDFIGSPYTQCNKREGATFISEMLDRFLANS